MILRLEAAGLLPLVRMLEATDEDDGQAGGGDNPSRRFPIDRSLLAALLDRWRPETHTYHLPCGEMTITLQDVSMLMGLPIAGAAVGGTEPPDGWRQILLDRFHGVIIHDEGFSDRETHGPTLKWLNQYTVNPCRHFVMHLYLATHKIIVNMSYLIMQVDMMANDATRYQVARHLEAYLLWLFGWVMFTTPHGNTVDARLIEYARQIADSDPQDIPQYS